MFWLKILGFVTTNKAGKLARRSQVHQCELVSNMSCVMSYQTEVVPTFSPGEIIIISLTFTRQNVFKLYLDADDALHSLDDI